MCAASVSPGFKGSWNIIKTMTFLCGYMGTVRDFHITLCHRPLQKVLKASYAITLKRMLYYFLGEFQLQGSLLLLD